MQKRVTILQIFSMEYGTGYYHQHNMKGCALQVCRRSLSENLRSGSSPSAADQAAEEKRRKVADNDRRTHGGGEQLRPRAPEAEAPAREPRGKAHDRAEALEHPHGGQSRENNQTGDQHRAHHPHSNHDRDRGQNRYQHVIERHIDAGRLSLALIKGIR